MNGILRGHVSGIEKTLRDVAPHPLNLRSEKKEELLRLLRALKEYENVLSVQIVFDRPEMEMRGY